jgi:hypothetical protein
MTRGARPAAIAAGCLTIAGVALVLWYTKWGVHGCDDSAAAGGCHERMDRDFTIYLLGVAALAVGIFALGLAAVRARRERSR